MTRKGYVWKLGTGWVEVKGAKFFTIPGFEGFEFIAHRHTTYYDLWVISEVSSGACIDFLKQSSARKVIIEHAINTMPRKVTLAHLESAIANAQLCDGWHPRRTA